MQIFDIKRLFKTWLLVAPLMQNKTHGVYALPTSKTDNKDLANSESKDENKNELEFSNQTSTTTENIISQQIQQSYQNHLDAQNWAKNLSLDTSTDSSWNLEARPKNDQQAALWEHEFEEQHHHDLQIEHNRHKRRYYANKEIEFINNDFFYKFDVNYDTGRVEGPISYGIDYKTINVVIINNWTKYAKNWSEFEEKFPEIEIINLRGELGGQGNTAVIAENNVKFKTSLNENKRSFLYPEMKVNNNDYDIIDCSKALVINTYKYHLIVARQFSCNSIKLVLSNEELQLQISFVLESVNAVYKTFGSLKFDSIRLVGKVDWNPLLALTIEQSKNIEDWYVKSQKIISDNKNDRNFTPERIKNIEDAFYAEFILWLTQLRTDFIQNLVLIDHENKINDLSREIQKIKERLNNIEQSKSCIQNIVQNFKSKTTTSSSDKIIDNIADGKPIKVIFKETIKAFTTSLIKGPLNAILGCLVDSITHSLKKREIFDISKLEDKNYKKQTLIANELQNTMPWNKNITNLINNQNSYAKNNVTNHNMTNGAA